MTHRRRPASPVTLPSDTFPTSDEIASRAYCLARAACGRVERSAFWRQAEQELLDIGARRALARQTGLRRSRQTHKPRSDERRR